VNLRDDDDRTVAAGEYVLGTLGADERREFKRSLARDAALQAEVYAWQDRLLPLAVRGVPHKPISEGWTALEARLDQRDAAPGGRVVQQSHGATSANDPLWRRLRRWQTIAGSAIAASVVLATLLLLRGPALQNERYLAVLQAPDDNAAGWVVEITAGQQLRLRPVGAATPVPAGSALQFWTKTVSATSPTSLGLVTSGQITELPVSRLPALEAQQLFELTLEPATGSPIGRPTGPILYVGRTVRL